MFEREQAKRLSSEPGRMLDGLEAFGQEVEREDKGRHGEGHRVRYTGMVKHR